MAVKCLIFSAVPLKKRWEPCCHLNSFPKGTSSFVANARGFKKAATTKLASRYFRLLQYFCATKEGVGRVTQVWYRGPHHPDDAYTQFAPRKNARLIA